MDIFEYLPQLIVAYDGNDEFANLIHVKKANKDIDYFCPCCGGIVKPRALDSTKEQSHYYHITGKCTKESQLHFFCKNWLFEKGSKFYLGDILYEVDFIDIEKIWNTPFGDYKPDISVYTTTGKIIYFEIFFTNRKTGDNYFCKWDYLENSVVEVNIKEYMFKTGKDVIPTFTYLYHEGICYSKPYAKKDLYANTIARIKHDLTRQKVLNYKARIEKLDWFWQEIQQNKSREDILKVVSCMEYDDMVTCYEIINKKNCVSYLKNDMLDILNESVIKKVRESIDLPFDENVYFDLKQRHGRTYEAGIILNIELDHITFNDFVYHIMDNWHFNKISGYPKIVFKTNIFSSDIVDIPSKEIKKLKQLFNDTVEYKSKLSEYEKELYLLEEDGYKIRINNGYYTVLKKNKNSDYDLILDKFYLSSLRIDDLKNAIDEKITEINEKVFLENIKKNEYYQGLLKELRNYNGIKSNVEIKYGKCGCTGLYISLWLYGKEIESHGLNPDENSLIDAINQYKNKIILFIDRYQFVYEVINRINNCKNKLWTAEFYIDPFGDYCIRIILNVIKGYRYRFNNVITLWDIDTNDIDEIIHQAEKSMKHLLKRIEMDGYRIVWINGGEK